MSIYPDPDPQNGSEAAGEPSAVPPDDGGDLDCGHCGCWFTTIDAYDVHRPNGKCIRPTDCGLVVAPRVRLTWSIPVRVLVEVDAFGNVTQWVMADRDIAGQWDQRQWRDSP